MIGPMCKGIDCDVAHNCLRYRALPIEGQRYRHLHQNKPAFDKHGFCKDFVFKGGAQPIRKLTNEERDRFGLRITGGM